jgi:hypothetical protein
MSYSRRSPSQGRAAAVAFLAVVVLIGIATVATSASQAAYYKVVACAANNGAPPYTTDTNTKGPDAPKGIFDIWNRCDGEGGDPPGDAALMRIQENRDPPNTVRPGAYANIYFDAPASTHFKAAGGFTRQPFQFNDGWRTRFWIATASSTQQILSQGAGANVNGQQPSSSIFGPHVWPVGGYLDFNRFVFELMCVRAARCDTSGNNAADLNGIVFIMSDDSDSRPEFTRTDASLLAGRWVKGSQDVTFSVADAGSGIRQERLYVDSSELWSLDHGPECNTAFTPSNGEWARSYSPCPTGGPWNRSISINTAAFKDGSTHVVQACTQDFAQFQGVSGTGGSTCTARTIATDNTAPAAPGGLSVVTPNPARYLSQVGAQFSLPPNEGSPITKAYYNVVDAAGNVVTPAQEVDQVNPTAIQTINGPGKPGDYRLRVWLQDEVGFVGPAATVAIPHDTTPPAAPQNLSVVAPKTPKKDAGFDMTWHNLNDSGSPIDAAHYRIVDGEGAAVAEDAITGEGIEAIKNLDTPRDRGGFTLQLWLSDAEGNVGAPVSVPLVYDCVRDDVDSGALLSSSIGPEGAGRRLVGQGNGGLLVGKLLDGNGVPVSGAPICVFSQVVTDSVRKFLGVAVTGADGSYEFAIRPGASRDLMVDYRSEHREISSKVQLITKVRPTFEVESTVVRDGVARFRGTVPGPHNDEVQVVLQAKKGHGWIVFRRLGTGKYGNYEGAYRFNKTTQPTEYIMRAQIRKQSGFPYHGGSSEAVAMVVYPHRAQHHGHHKKGSGHRQTKRDDCRGKKHASRHCGQSQTPSKSGGGKR